MECLLCGKVAMDRDDNFCSTECKVEANQMKYKIVRMFFEGYPNRIMKRGLNLEEARAWCRDPETSSSTATGKKEKRLRQKYGEWFDGFAEDKKR